MSKIYDIFADKYIDEEEIELSAPPERYVHITEEMLINNAAKWIVEQIEEDEECPHFVN